MTNQIRKQFVYLYEPSLNTADPIGKKNKDDKNSIIISEISTRIGKNLLQKIELFSLSYDYLKYKNIFFVEIEYSRTNKKSKDKKIAAVFPFTESIGQYIDLLDQPLNLETLDLKEKNLDISKIEEVDFLKIATAAFNVIFKNETLLFKGPSRQNSWRKLLQELIFFYESDYLSPKRKAYLCLMPILYKHIQEDWRFILLLPNKDFLKDILKSSSESITDERRTSIESLSNIVFNRNFNIEETRFDLKNGNDIVEKKFIQEIVPLIVTVAEGGFEDLYYIISNQLIHLNSSSSVYNSIIKECKNDLFIRYMISKVDVKDQKYNNFINFLLEITLHKHNVLIIIENKDLFKYVLEKLELSSESGELSKLGQIEQEDEKKIESLFREKITKEEKIKEIEELLIAISVRKRAFFTFMQLPQILSEDGFLDLVSNNMHFFDRCSDESLTVHIEHFLDLKKSGREDVQEKMALLLDKVKIYRSNLFEKIESRYKNNEILKKLREDLQSTEAKSVEEKLEQEPEKEASVTMTSLDKIEEESISKLDSLHLGIEEGDIKENDSTEIVFCSSPVEVDLPKSITATIHPISKPEQEISLSELKKNPDAVIQAIKDVNSVIQLLSPLLNEILNEKEYNNEIERVSVFFNANPEKTASQLFLQVLWGVAAHYPIFFQLIQSNNSILRTILQEREKDVQVPNSIIEFIQNESEKIKNLVQKVSAAPILQIDLAGFKTIDKAKLSEEEKRILFTLNPLSFAEEINSLQDDELLLEILEINPFCLQTSFQNNRHVQKLLASLKQVRNSSKKKKIQVVDFDFNAALQD